MIPRAPPPIDGRDSNAILEQFRNRRYGYLPMWNPPDKSAGDAISQIFARFVSAILQRLNQAPAKDKLAYLDLLGLRLVPAQAARAPIVLKLSQGAPDSSAPAGTQVAAPPPPGSSQQVVFETEEDSGVTAARLAQVVSLWPGRDQYIDHSAAYQASQPFTLFQNSQLQPTAHILYLAHNTLLAFAGASHLEVEVNLAQGSSSPLEIAWEYWDGQVWRRFKSNRPTCLEAAEKGHDGTNGLIVSGSVRLDTDCAKTAARPVNGVQSYWIRGRLTQPLLPDPAELLPEAETIRLRTRIDQSLEFHVTAAYSPIGKPNTIVNVHDECGQPFANVTVIISQIDDLSVNVPPAALTGSDGTVTVHWTLAQGKTYRFDVAFEGVTGTTQASYNLVSEVAKIDIVVKVKGLLPDKAISDGKTLDVTKAFYPLGQLPQPGSAFYFRQDEIFSKPGARVQLYIDAVNPPPPPSDSKPMPHVVNWEYWNGEEWTLLFQSTDSSAPSKDFTVNEVIEFIVPPDMASTKVNNEDGLWIRARLTNGGYGQTLEIKIPNASPASIPYTQPQPPAVAVFRFGYTWIKGPSPLEEVLTYNDFQFEDHTDDARWPGKRFSPYKPISEVMPALYLGFDKPLPVNNFGIYLDIVEQSGQAAGPALVWEYWNGGDWRELSFRDETQRLALPGILTFIPARDSEPLARFDVPLHWLRGRLKEDGPPSEATLNNIFPNAVWASQWRTFTSVPLGASTGMPSQVFQFNQIPVLAGQEIEVRELSGPRANTEWRSLAMEVATVDPNIIKEFETLLGSEGTQTDIVLGKLRLTRNKSKRVTEVWVRWEERANFFSSASRDRVYVLEHASGRLFFGDQGMVPPATAAIRAARFRSGGGLSGNAAAGTITQLLGSVSGVQGITNPRAAEGGADGETLEAFAVRAPFSIRHRGRAITPLDYETMAHEAAAAVAVARAIPTRNPAGIPRPGWVTLLIIPESQEPRPMPSFGLREAVRRYLEQHAPGDVSAAHRIEVIGPTYLPIDVTATLAPRDPSRAGTLEQNALDALAKFLHPLRGGPDGLGWDLGRGVFISDIADVLGSVDGVDYVEALSLSVNGVLQGEHVDVPADQIVVAGQIILNLIVPSTA